MTVGGKLWAGTEHRGYASLWQRLLV